MYSLRSACSAHLVWSIMFRPNAVVEDEISRQGILPMVAPVNPYTLLALICRQPSHDQSTSVIAVYQACCRVDKCSSLCHAQHCCALSTVRLKAGESIWSFTPVQAPAPWACPTRNSSRALHFKRANYDMNTAYSPHRSSDLQGALQSPNVHEANVPRVPAGACPAQLS